MSDHESSYYEIALTHRQVVVSFVVLLVFVAGVFLCGVWVGKNDAREPDRPEAPQVADGNGPEVPTDLEGVEEYSFDQGAAGPEESDEGLDKPDLSLLENPTPQTTLAQDLGRDPETPVREAPPPPPRPQASSSGAEAAPPEPSQEPPPDATPTQPSEGPPPVTSDDGPFRPTATIPAPSPTPAGQEPSSGFVVQVFSGRDEDQAKRVVQTLKSDGYQAYLSPVRVGSQMRYRVRIGPYDDREDAEGVERMVRQKYRYETWVTSAEN
ncbi:MAG: SPOR domain-containing protein [Thermoanaerobaculia bacterium]|nr:SPOR domain-containing protein [Thermoanaerobaculia bacterium]